jgi:hypothetical protein
MLPIYALGKMHQFQTFDKPLRSNHDILRWARKFDPYPQYLPETLKFLGEYKPGILPWLYMAAILGIIRVTALALLPGFVKRYLTRFGYFVDLRRQENAYENPDTLNAIKKHACKSQDRLTDHQ